MSNDLGGHPFFMHPMNLVGRSLERGTANEDHQRNANKMIEELWNAWEKRGREIESLTEQLIAIKAAIGGNIVPLVAQLDDARRRLDRG